MLERLLINIYICLKVKVAQVKPTLKIIGIKENDEGVITENGDCGDSSSNHSNCKISTSTEVSRSTISEEKCDRKRKRANKSVK